MLGFGFGYNKMLPRLGGDEALAFIAAHEAATGLTMGEVQKLAILGFVDRLKGNGTTNGSDIWTKAISNNARMWIHAPSNDSTISFSGCNVELFSQTTLGTFNNFVSGDLTVYGLKGGTGKYFETNISSDMFPVDNYGYGFYSRTNVKGNSYIDAGANSGNYFQTRVNADGLIARINTTGPDFAVSPFTDSRGLFQIQSESTTNASLAWNGNIISSSTKLRTTSSNSLTFHKYNTLYSIRQ